MISFAELHQNRMERLNVRDAPAVLLCLDPGQTTGCAVFKHTQLVHASHLPTGDPNIAQKSLQRVLEAFLPTELVMEDYRVYPHRVQQHMGSALLTPRLIGAIESMCITTGIPYHKQMAGDPKQFVTDVKLKAWNMYPSGLKHARDAIRHGCYYIIFPPKTLYSQRLTYESKGQHVG